MEEKKPNYENENLQFVNVLLTHKIIFSLKHALEINLFA